MTRKKKRKTVEKPVPCDLELAMANVCNAVKDFCLRPDVRDSSMLSSYAEELNGVIEKLSIAVFGEPYFIKRERELSRWLDELIDSQEPLPLQRFMINGLREYADNHDGPLAEKAMRAFGRYQK